MQDSGRKAKVRESPPSSQNPETTPMLQLQTIPCAVQLQVESELRHQDLVLSILHHQTRANWASAEMAGYSKAQRLSDLSETEDQEREATPMELGRRAGAVAVSCLRR